MPDVVFSVFNENFTTPSKLVDLSLKFGSIGVSMVFRWFSLCCRFRDDEKRVPLRKVFVLLKAFRLSGFSSGSLWILGDLDSSCVLKLSLLRSEHSDLLSDSQMSA